MLHLPTAQGLPVSFNLIDLSVIMTVLWLGILATGLLRPTLIVGHNAEAAHIITALRKNLSSGLVPVGCLASSQEDRLALDYCNDHDVPCLGAAGEIRRVLDERHIDTVLMRTIPAVVLARGAH